MAPTTAMGLLTLAMSFAVGLGGAGLVRHARGLPAPDEPAGRTVTGTVLDAFATPCFFRGGRPRQTCYRTVVDYVDGGRPMQVSSRTVYHPARHRKGEAAEVYVLADGTAWIASEWQERQAERRREHESRRGFPLTMGWILIGCAAFGVLLGAGLIFWVDRSGDTPAT